MCKRGTVIVVQGIFRLAPNDRDQFIAESLETQRISRAETGCLEYVFAVDPCDPERVVLSELWESQADLDAHAAALTERRRAEAEAGHQRVEPLSRDVRFYEAELIER